MQVPGPAVVNGAYDTAHTHITVHVVRAEQPDALFLGSHAAGDSAWSLRRSGGLHRTEPALQALAPSALVSPAPYCVSMNKHLSEHQ